ncbi:MAG: hypothetical protein MR779_04565 [Tenericutes bacterium]|nr:hypothetical protein [Mycoplasmatota bacterium]
MNLWVRSQDKRILQKVDNIFLDANYENKRISTYDGDNVELGTYKTKERAIEVLDEIQKTLKPQLIIKDSGKIIGSFETTIIREGTTYELKELSTYVYEMPGD